MKRNWPFVALGVAAFLLFALITLPAHVVLSRLQSAGVQADGVTGTIWNGAAQVLTVQGARIGSVEWDLHVLPLFIGRASADVNVKRIDGFLDTQLSASPAGRLSMSALTGSLPLSALPPNAVRGWNGTLNLRLPQLVIENGWPSVAEGTVEAINLTGPASQPANLGSYKVTFPENAANDGVLTGALADIGGPLQVQGALRLTAANRGYHIEGTIATRPDAPAAITKMLEYLGPPDAQGQRQFGTEGTF